MTTRPVSGLKVTAALPPYLTALSTRFEIARRKAVGRQEIVTLRGPENVTGSPASEASSQNSLDERAQVDERAGLALRVIPSKGEDELDHVPHHVEIAQHLLLLVLILDEFRAKPQTRQRRREGRGTSRRSCACDPH